MAPQPPLSPPDKGSGAVEEEEEELEEEGEEHKPAALEQGAEAEVPEAPEAATDCRARAPGARL